jgi:hypothetical protein
LLDLMVRMRHAARPVPQPSRKTPPPISPPERGQGGEL